MASDPTRVVLALLAGLSLSCGGRAETGSELDPLFEALNDRASAAAEAWCERANECYGPPERSEYRCSVPTSNGGVSYASGDPCDPGLVACHRRLWNDYQDDFIELRECQIAQSNAYSACLDSCPEVADGCVAEQEQTACVTTLVLSAGFRACLEEFCPL